MLGHLLILPLDFLAWPMSQVSGVLTERQLQRYRKTGHAFNEAKANSLQSLHDEVDGETSEDSDRECQLYSP